MVAVGVVDSFVAGVLVDEDAVAVGEAFLAVPAPVAFATQDWADRLERRAAVQ